MSRSNIDNNDEMGEKASTPAASVTSSPSETKDENDYRRDKGSLSDSNLVAVHDKESCMDIFMLVLVITFVLAGLAICCFIVLYIYTGVYWRKHGFIRKFVRIAASLSQFFVFTIVSCTVKRGLYYRDDDRFSRSFWRRLMSVLCPIVSNHPMKSFLTKSEDQNLSQNRLLLQSNKNCYTKLKYALQRYWPYGIVIMLFTEIVRCSLLSAYKEVVYYLHKEPTDKFPQRDINLRLFIELAISVYYLLSLFIILPTFCGIIHIYSNRITECKFFENEFSKVPINWQNQAIMKLSELKHLLSLIQKGTVRERTLANKFSSFYILNIIVYSASYAFYLIITAKINDADHWRILGLLVTSALTLIILMLYTNSSGNKLKKQAAHIYCVNDCEGENNAEFVERDTTDLNALSKAGPLAKIRGWETIVNQFDSYAVFFIFSSIPAQLLIYAAGSVVPWIVLTIVKAHDYSL